MDIITGKQMFEERRRLLQGHGRLTKGELDHNCGVLAQEISKHLPSDVGFVLVLVPRDSDEFGSTASPQDWSRERTARVLKKAMRRVLEAGSRG